MQNVFVTESYNLKSCKAILNILSPSYENSLHRTEQLKKNYEMIIQNIIKEANKRNYKKIALPLIGVGANFVPTELGIPIILDSIINEYFAN
jgi:O-acetyl-ADP-ribose deacetylase (regulator of RNase III)